MKFDDITLQYSYSISGSFNRLATLPIQDKYMMREGTGKLNDIYNPHDAFKGNTSDLYSGTVKRHNVGKHHDFLDTGFKNKLNAIFSPCYHGCQL